ncbi:MAG: hypothetical protein JWN46_458 [Acidimicrobiales bacterium]|nr:hypothetical protein [Acidimicrobiales bacterium]
MQTTSLLGGGALVLGLLASSACSSSDHAGSQRDAHVDHTVQLEAKGYRYVGTVGPLRAGERVQFALKNDDALDHELELFGPDGTKLGEIGPTRPGATGHAVIALSTTGRYRYSCGISDHKTRGMSGTFTVT